MEDPWNFCH